MISSLKLGNNSFPFIGNDSTNSTPYKVWFNKGRYFVELYGASGPTEFCGRGGYSYGILTIKNPRYLYLYIGGQGITTDSRVHLCIEGGWNGGGRACSFWNQCTGGGGTDIRLSENNEYNERIIIAGGGGGSASSSSSRQNDQYKGGDGGGIIGGNAYGYSGKHNIAYSKTYSKGGTDTNGGESYQKKNDNQEMNENGKKGVGGMCVGGDGNCGAGGGGYYGGGGGFDVTGGGGGSSYYDPTFIKNGHLLRSDHYGNGIIFITKIAFISRNYIYPFIFLPFISIILLL